MKQLPQCFSFHLHFPTLFWRQNENESENFNFKGMMKTPFEILIVILIMFTKMNCLYCILIIKFEFTFEHCSFRADFENKCLYHCLLYAGSWGLAHIPCVIAAGFSLDRLLVPNAKLYYHFQILK